jgi:hypothetical protein
LQLVDAAGARPAETHEREDFERRRGGLLNMLTAAYQYGQPDIALWAMERLLDSERVRKGFVTINILGQYLDLLEKLRRGNGGP